nr:tetratricopeptide repeat protein 16 [Pogona vitticeps]
MEPKEEKEKEPKDVKMSTVYLGFFPTAVTEEKLEEARQKSIRRIFGTTDSLRYIKDPNKVGTYEGILQQKIEEHCQEGNRFFSQGEWEKAIVCFSKALNLDPDKVVLYEKTAEAFLQLCDFQSAAQHLRKAYSMSAAKETVAARLAFVLLLQGQCLYEQRVYLDALESFTRASELQPLSTLYRMRRIACLAALKRYNDCLQMVNEEASRETKNPDLFVLRARLYEHFGKVTLSFYNIQDALRLDQEHTEARVMLSKWKRRAQKAKDQAVNKAVKGSLKTALLKINQAIEYNPVDAGYFLFRGSILRRLKDFGGAIDDYLKAVDLSQGDEEGHEVRSEGQKQVLRTYNDFAVHCYARGCYEEAVLLLNKAIQGEKSEQGLYVNRGDCFLQLGERHFALEDYRQALELKPLAPSLQKRVARLHNEMGLQEFRERRYPQAESLFSQAIEHNPRELKYYLHRAKSRMFLQEVMGAKEDLVTALLLDPKREEAHVLANNFFPGESIHSLLNSKICTLAKALLNRRLEASPAYEVPASRERLEGRGKEPPNDAYVLNEDPGKSRLEKKEKKPQDHEERRLAERLAACQRKANEVNQELKGVREKKVSLRPASVRLDPNPHLTEREQRHSEEPYHWRKFTQGIGPS